jgi:hypothetical protein
MAATKTIRSGRAATKTAKKARGANRDRKRPVDLAAALVDAYLTNELINQTLLGLLDPSIWDRRPSCSVRRTIASTFAHAHNVRCMRLKMCGATPPPPLSRTATIEETRGAFAESAKATVLLLRQALAAGGHLPNYQPDVIAFVCLAVAHEAHRGQVCRWSRVLGKPIAPEHQLRLWEWHKRWQEVVAC